MVFMAEVAGAGWSSSLDEPASPSPDFNFDSFHARNAVPVDDINWLSPEGLSFEFSGSPINSQLSLQDAHQFLYQDSRDYYPVAFGYSPIQQRSGGALAEADSYPCNHLFTTTNESDLDV